ncbi:hypothetical protein K2173_011354 [Erythroxylum novogranatense]|uniref:Cytochrome P450 n=1 Tax=Erythroxylum novogranatense TaxID=1862640 RepID=A0AAV8S9H4_9ROSI|nr:hypothetical protein K2173_011354 [Erythroxylum novogranatense]
MEILYCFIVFLVCIFSTIVLKYMSMKFTSKTHLFLPPSPPSLPLIGHLHHLSSDLSKSFCTLSSKYGPLLRLRLGFYNLFVVSSSSLATEMFTTHDLAFSGKPKSVFEDSGLFAESGIIMAPYGDHWKFMKKLCVTQLLGAQQIQKTKRVRREELEQLLRRLVDKAHKKELVDISSEMLRTTNNGICRMVMSTRCSGEDSEAEMCRDLVKSAFELAGKLMIAKMFGPLSKLGYWVNGKKLEDVSRRCNDLLERIMNEHEQRAKRNDDHETQDKDLMNILLQVYKDERSEFKISRSIIKAFIMDLFIAGTTTSADAIVWVMVELKSHPKIFNKVREEIESVVGKSGRLVEESDISKLPYLQAVVKETLRVHPPGPILPRQSREDCRLGNFYIPQNSVVFLNS